MISPVTMPPSEDIARALRELVPGAFSEGRLDPAALMKAIGQAEAGGAERYGFGWVGKREAVTILNTPSAATLVPDEEASFGGPEARHVFIEGENLEVLKALHRSLFGRVSLIYIDPPYNTTSDLIYDDDRTDPLGAYLRRSGQVGEDGALLASRPDRAGRLHSNWLSFMFPRLSIARQLLREDGIILVSIDDHEVHNLRMLMDEVFGEENFIAQLVWEKGRKNDAKLFSVGHEYVLVYARSLTTLKEGGTVWREPKPGAREVWDKYLALKAEHGDDTGAMETALRAWYAELPAGNPAKKLSRYKHIDANGPWRDRDISWPGGGGPRYDVPHPETGRPCKVPDAGWRFSNPAEMERQIRLGLVQFRPTDEEPPFRKAHLRPVAAELADNGDAPLDDEEGEGAEEVGMQVMGSYIYQQSQVAVKYLKRLLGGKAFDNPKDHEVIARLIRYCTKGDSDLVLDFFGGSGTTAEAVAAANALDGGSRRSIVVQFREPIPESHPARALGFATIPEVTRTRIKRAFEAEAARAGATVQAGLGLRAFRLAESARRAWTGTASADGQEYARQLEAFVDPLPPGANPKDVAWEAMLREGLGPFSDLEEVPVPLGEEAVVFLRAADPDRGAVLYLCFDSRLSLAAVRELGLGREDVLACPGSLLDDTLAANLALQCRLKAL